MQLPRSKARINVELLVATQNGCPSRNNEQKPLRKICYGTTHRRDMAIFWILTTVEQIPFRRLRSTPQNTRYQLAYSESYQHRHGYCKYSITPLTELVEMSRHSHNHAKKHGARAYNEMTSSRSKNTKKPRHTTSISPAMRQD